MASSPEVSDAMVEAILDAQADLQTALGVHRLDGCQGRRSDMVEDRMAKSLARLHALLDAVGRPMYDPATHPEVEPLKVALLNTTDDKEAQGGD